MIGGLQVITNANMVDGPFEDWSQVRSHGRAARRRRQGHPQRIRLYYLPSKTAITNGDKIICHPAMLDEIKRQLDPPPKPPHSLFPGLSVATP